MPIPVWKYCNDCKPVRKIYIPKKKTISDKEDYLLKNYGVDLLLLDECMLCEKDFVIKQNPVLCPVCRPVVRKLSTEDIY